MPPSVLGRPRPSLSLLLGCLVSLAAFAALPAPARPQAPLDPRSLVGAWEGSWREMHLQRQSGEYYLWIDRVEGDRIHGHIEVMGPGPAKRPFVGTLSGNRLTFGRNVVTEFVIDGDQMRGHTQGRGQREITLTRRK